MILPLAVNQKKVEPGYVPPDFNKKKWSVMIVDMGPEKLHRKGEMHFSKHYYGHYKFSDRDTISQQPYVEGDPFRFVLRTKYEVRMGQQNLYHLYYTCIYDRKRDVEHRSTVYQSLYKSMKFWGKKLEEYRKK